jgi:uncharacterized protein YciI
LLRSDAKKKKRAPVRRAFATTHANRATLRIKGGTLIFTFILIDKPGMSELRQRMRPEHKAYLAEVADRIAFAGPFTHDDGTTMLGSLLAIAFASRDAAHQWLAQEPFTRAGLYSSVTVHAFVNLWPQRAGFPPG